MPFGLNDACYALIARSYTAAPCVIVCRVFTITSQQAADPDHSSKHKGQPKQQQQQQEDLEAPRPKAAAPVRPATAKRPATVTPKTHTARAIFLHNALTAIWWLVWTYLLVASHVPALPPHKVLAKALTRKNATKPLMPVYGLVALAYVGLGLLQQVLQMMGDRLPRKVAFLARTVRKENARMAEHYLPFSTSSCFLGNVSTPVQAEGSAVPVSTRGAPQATVQGGG